MKKSIGNAKDDSERRRALRVKSDAEVVVAVETPVSMVAQLLDMSDTGALIGLPREVPIGQRLLVDISPDEVPLVLSGKVVRHGPAPLIVGLQWDGLNEVQKQKLDAFLSTINVLGHSPNDRGLRIKARADVDVTQLSAGPKAKGLLQDVSTGGASIVVSSQLNTKIGAKMTLQFDELRLSATVVRIEPRGKICKVALKFRPEDQGVAQRIIGKQLGRV